MTMNERDYHEQGAVGPGKYGQQATQPIRLKRSWPENLFLTEHSCLQKAASDAFSD